MRPQIYAQVALVAAAFLTGREGRCQEPVSPVRISLGAVLGGFGVESGPAEAEIGMVSDVAVAKDGTMFVIDMLAGRVRAVTQLGQYLAGFGRPGGGPGEFGEALAVAYNDQASEVYVLDNRLARISVLTWDGAIFGYSRSIERVPWALDLCYMGGRLYLYAPLTDGAAGVVRTLSITGSELARFGDPFGAGESPMVQRIHGLALLTCLPHLDMLTLTSESQGSARAYSADGRILWESGPPRGFRPKPMEVTASGGVRFDVEGSDKPIDRHDAVFSVGSDIIGLQYERRAEGRSPGLSTGTERFTVLYSAPTGKVLGVQRGLPRIIAALDSIAYIAENEPFPRVESRKVLIEK